MLLFLFLSHWIRFPRVELALWTHSLATQLQPDLLDGIPTASITSSTTVVETVKGENGDDSIITTTTVTDDAESTADENSTDVVTDNESRVGGGDDDIEGELKVTSAQITTTESNNIANNTNNCSNSNSNTSIKPNHINTDAKDETEDSTELTEQPPPVLNGNNTASSATEQSDESNLERPVQVIAANGNNKNGEQKMHITFSIKKKKICACKRILLTHWSMKYLFTFLLNINKKELKKNWHLRWTFGTTHEYNENENFIWRKLFNFIRSIQMMITKHISCFSGVEDLIDDSSRSDDSSLEKSATPIVANDDSDSQTSSIKR